MKPRRSDLVAVDLLDFLATFKRLAKQALGNHAGEPASGGFVRWKHVVIHGLRREERHSFRETENRLEYMGDIRDVLELENDGVPQVHADDRDEDWLDTLFAAFDISSLADVYPASLSGGEKQRVAAARALANRPAVVLADEPTGQLDPSTADQLLELLWDLQAETNTVLVVISHDRRIADRFSDTVFLQNGRIVGQL